ncbi:hypothetical protein [Maribellus sp. YY47]|uniref:hypothetical protein n=1 Tax=Maribellus sp. YY47 TaxID=2929486 RepID=UPI0020013FAB|nr:hypothetical protein [Maribellus sp. YY47]MCK3685687.1 hypothetical protein [Maribellus sp. YY47]
MSDTKKFTDSEKLLGEVLREEPDFFLSDRFAETVANKMARRFAWNQYIREFFIYLAAIFGIAALSAGIALIWLDVNWQAWWSFLLYNVSWVAGLNILVVFILFVDRVLLRYFSYKLSQH